MFTLWLKVWLFEVIFKVMNRRCITCQASTRTIDIKEH